MNIPVGSALIAIGLAFGLAATLMTFTVPVELTVFLLLAMLLCSLGGLYLVYVGYRERREGDGIITAELVHKVPPIQAPTVICPYCRTPVSTAFQTGRVSAFGLVMFVVLLILFFPLCWIGLLIKEYRVRCYRCGMEIGKC